ncbi:MAG TPA: prolipoprotein diacylglyceryl transferase [Candidatus Megaira endosymbiont of Hartmannula sinica]|nr:prolipoprotein diacylglyceryl transferase [Candidatus Megaera endosymbiont of Hartmannula sinica]
MFIHQYINPVIAQIGPFTITWYGLSYAAGILFGIFYLNKIVNKYKNKLDILLSSQNIDNLATYVIIGIILGGRIGYVLFYNYEYYINNPLDIVKTYEGGMSFHGALIGYVIACLIFAKGKKDLALNIYDLSAICAPIGIFFGRCANFINAELYGKKTDIFIGVIFPGSDYKPRHPSQLYEAFFEGIILFIILNIIAIKYEKIKYRGYSSGIFLILYSFFRFNIEFFREPDSHIGYIINYFSMGQILSLPMLLIGIYLTANSYSKSRKNKYD